MSNEDAKSVQGMSCQSPVNPDPQGWPCQHATDYQTECKKSGIANDGLKCKDSFYFVCKGDTYKKITSGPDVDGVCVDDPNGKCCTLVDDDCVHYVVVNCKWTPTIWNSCVIEMPAPINYQQVWERCSDCLEDSNSSPDETAEGTKKVAVECL